MIKESKCTQALMPHPSSPTTAIKHNKKDGTQEKCKRVAIHFNLSFVVGENLNIIKIMFLKCKDHLTLLGDFLDFYFLFSLISFTGFVSWVLWSWLLLFCFVM